MPAFSASLCVELRTVDLCFEETIQVYSLLYYLEGLNRKVA